MELQEVLRAMTSAIAPVFLINGVGLILSSMVLRYNRLIDRARVFEELAWQESDTEEAAAYAKRMLRVYRRVRHIRNTIILAALSIFWVVVTIVSIFGQLVFKLPITLIPEIAFILSLLCLITALALYIMDFASSLHILKEEMKETMKRCGV